MAKPEVVYVCSKCGAKCVQFQLIGKGRLICRKCADELRRFIEKQETTTLPE